MVAKPTAKMRLDQLLVEQGFYPSRAQAQAAIMAGQVQVNGQRVDKAGQSTPVDARIDVATPMRYVSRGGLKLEKALADFQISPEGRVCLDVGSSTGGFTDCLLQAGAIQVYAVDVGQNQLDWKLRSDARVVVMEKTHIRDVSPESLEPSPSLAVIDVSFISLKKVLPYTAACLNGLPEPQPIIALVKPQFEYLDYCQPKGFDGIVQQTDDQIAILTGLFADLQRELPDILPQGLIASPIHGAKGNREYLLYLEKSSESHGDTLPLWQTIIDQVHEVVLSAM